MWAAVDGQWAQATMSTIPTSTSLMVTVTSQEATTNSNLSVGVGLIHSPTDMDLETTLLGMGNTTDMMLD